MGDSDEKLMQAVLKTMLNSSKDMIFIKNEKLIYKGCSPAFSSIVGISDPADIVGKTDFDIFADQELAKRYTEDDMRLMSGKELKTEYVEPLPAVDGRPRYGATSKHVIRDKNGALIGLLGISRDITREYEARLNYERELRYLFELPPDALVAALFDITDWRVVDIRTRNDSDHIISHYATINEFVLNAADSAVEDKHVARFFHSFSQNSIYRIYESGKRSMELEYLRKFPNGKALWVKNEFHFLIDPVSGNLSVLVILFDIDEAKRSRDAIRRAAENDGLTGLLNREATMKYIDTFLSADGSNGMHALFLIDIDNFKTVNDTFGHQVGDRVISEIATLIKSVFRETDIVGRIGGDEFFVLMKNTDKNSTRSKAHNLIFVLQHICATPSTKLELSASVGISIFDNGDKNLERLYKEADLALYHSKECGKNQFSFYNSSSDVKSLITKSDGYISTVNLYELLNKIDAGIIICHTNPELNDAKPVFISDTFFAMMGGLDRENGFMLYSNFMKAVHPNDKKRVWQEYDNARYAERVLRSSYRVIGKDARYYNLAVTSNIIVNDDGSVDTYSVYTKLDI